MSCVVHFEIQASQPQPLMDFYSGLFGWSFTKGGASRVLAQRLARLIHQESIAGLAAARLGPNGGDATVNTFVCTMEIMSREKSLSQSIALGGTVVLPKMPRQGVAGLRTLRIRMVILSGSCCLIRRRISQP